MKGSKQLPYLLLAPIVLILVGLIFYPIATTFSFSLQNYKLTEPGQTRFIGATNYINAVKDPNFIAAVVNTLVVLGVLLVVCLIGSLIVATILKVESKLSGALMAIAIVPWALPPVVNGIVWNFIFFPGFGLINKILYSFKLIEQPIVWGTGRWDSLIIIALVVAWRVIPFCAVIILANMQAIDPQIYESARVDGASEWSIFKSITLPLLLPTFGIVLTNITIAGVNVFDEVVSIIGYRTVGQTVQIYNYNETFSFLNFGYGSAISYLIMMGSGILAYLYIRNVGRKLR